MQIDTMVKEVRGVVQYATPIFHLFFLNWLVLILCICMCMWLCKTTVGCIV